MKRLILLVIAALSVNAFGQKTHKAVSGNPISAEQFVEYQANDSTLYARTTYSYNSQKQVEKEIIFYDTSGLVDSIFTTYDPNNRVVLIEKFQNNTWFSSKTWNYDVLNQLIDYYENVPSYGGNPLWHVAYKGVRDFDNVEDAFSNLLFFMETEIELRDCDTMFVYQFPSVTPRLVMKILPYYKNGKPDSVKLEIDPVLFGDIIDSLSAKGVDIVDNLILTLLPTYNGGKLLKINGSALIKIDIGFPFPLPVTVPDFIVLENKYDNNDRLTETQTEMKVDLDLPLVDAQYLGGTKQLYSYDWYDNVSCAVLESSIDGNTWNIDSKTYYEYDIEDVYDIELNSIEPSNRGIDHVGDSINIKATLRNRSLTTQSQSIHITALIKDLQGNILDSLTDNIAPINAYSEITYTFTDAYVVPNIERYTITVYIDSQDTIPKNDTIAVERPTNHVGIKNINGVNIYVSQNIPNPAGDVTLFKYSIPTDGKVQFTIYSISGQVLLVHTEEAKQGENSLELSISHLASGLYFYSMEFNGQRSVKKMGVKKNN